jgi:predicted molibdopterin-dependent oxidoreductase YjgC
VLAVARAAGIDIPALCYHPAVTSYGACRLCLVEVTAGDRSRTVTSCCYPAREGLMVNTQAERAVRARRGVMELLLARAPHSPVLRTLAASMGITEPRLPHLTEGERDCILCGLCVNVCREVMGPAAISFAHRGGARIVEAPFRESSEACTGCGACAAVCPMGTVELRTEAAELEILPFNTRKPLRLCRTCGRPVAALAFTELLQERLGEGRAEAIEQCVTCKRCDAARAARRVPPSHHENTLR